VILITEKAFYGQQSYLQLIGWYNSHSSQKLYVCYFMLE